VKKGLELDPYDYPSHSAYGMCLQIARRYQEAEDHLKWTLSQRDFISAHFNLGAVYAMRGRVTQGEESRRYFDLALREAQAELTLETKGAGNPAETPTPSSDYMFAMFHAMRGDTASSHRWLSRLTAREDIDKLSPVSLVLIYGALGETETALSHLLQATRIRDRGLLYLKVHPLFDPLRDTEGYRQAIQIMRL
jgi:tetratricopeptide (TPR) repeat protein